MQLVKQGEAPQVEDIATVVARICAELEDVSRRIDHNQAMIARSTWTIGVEDNDYVAAMQDADLSAQRIAGIADFLRALGSGFKPDWRLDVSAATGTLKLAELVRSLGATSDTGSVSNTDSSGTVDLF